MTRQDWIGQQMEDKSKYKIFRWDDARIDEAKKKGKEFENFSK